MLQVCNCIHVLIPCYVGKFYLVDSGYPNRTGYLAPYKGTKYHLQEFRQGPMPRGKNELFNYSHSSLRNVIERSFRVLKMKWRILLDLPSYPMAKQSQIIMACMAVHNFHSRECFSGYGLWYVWSGWKLHSNGRSIVFFSKKIDVVYVKGTKIKIWISFRIG